jgi:hypothetical protein
VPVFLKHAAIDIEKVRGIDAFALSNQSASNIVTGNMSNDLVKSSSSLLDVNTI